MNKDETHKGATWEIKTRVSGEELNNYDFTKTNFNSSIFDNVSFENCLFDRSVLGGSKIFYDSNFKDCEFVKVDLSNSAFGSHKGIYKNCSFRDCSFKGKEFNFTRFIDCTFDKCKLRKINFNGSSFLNCNFIGPMDDITFNGIYDTDKSEFPTLENVNFSEATFGEFVTFINCNLSRCTPPKGALFNEILYNLYRNDLAVLSTGSADRIVLTRK